MTSDTLTQSENPQTRNLSSPILRFLRAHPRLCLILLSPGIPEYLSGSSRWEYLTGNPALFFLLLLLNIGLYGPGVILIREAMVRWRKGWATVFLLGFAYAIVEEGLALSTLYNPNAQPVGTLGVYGHWAGVNWVWTVGIVLFHSAVSIALPILLFRLAFPTLKSTRLVSNEATLLFILALGYDSLALFAIIRYWAGWPVILSSGLVIALLIRGARKAPANLLATSPIQPGRKPRTLGILGFLFFPAALLTGAIAAGANAPPWVPMIAEVIVSYLILRTILQSVGPQENQAQKTALAIGLVIPIVVFGLVASLGSSPLILVADAGFAFFLRRLWKKYNPRPTIPLMPRLRSAPETPKLVL